MPYNSVADNFHRKKFFKRYQRKQIEIWRFRSNVVTLFHNFRQKGTPPTNHFCMDSQANECPTTLPLTVFTQRNFVADFLQEKYNFRGKTAVLCFRAPPLGDLGATYDDHLRFVGKRVGDFLLVLIEVFSLGRMAEALRAIIGSKSAIRSNAGRLTQNFRQKGSPPTNHSSSQKTRINVLSNDIKI